MDESRIEKIDDCVYRGPSPRNLNDMHALRKLGIGCIVNFQIETSNYKLVLATVFGMEFVNVKCCPILPPTRFNVGLVRHIIGKRRSSGQRVYMCCRKSVDRTGFFSAAWRLIEQDWTYSMACREAVRMGMSWWLRWWLIFLAKYEQN